MATKTESVAEIAESLQRYVAHELLADHACCKLDTPFADLGVDSAALLSMLLFVERRFGIMVPDEELSHANLESIQTLAACVFRLASESTVE